ncbi:hypothetical protein FA13DRAFT_204588 [Coprinellus micaceus]|uniref:EF-hand domain-containing protein n=1 Tax=Coprinellus micaceus TaxID=71717 RepID=A0A4Y7SG05_COPMI|nr:hypothetical protein FA13DRAFT_204588 [Coprinellus micaceus]
MFEPTTEELDLLADILTFTGTEASRILPTEKAIDVFERSDLGRNDLKEIWRLADKDRNGMLTSMELAVGLRLIGWVQAGEELGEHLIDLPGPLPTLKGISDVQRVIGPSVIPDQLSPRRSPVHSRSPSLPFLSPPPHSANSLPGPPTPLFSPPPPPPPSGRSEPALPLSPLDNDDLANPIINLPPNTLHTISSLTSHGRSVRRKRAHTADSTRPPVPAAAPVPAPPPPPQLEGSAKLQPTVLPTPPVTATSSDDDPVTESPAQPGDGDADADATSSLANGILVTRVQVEEIPLEKPVESNAVGLDAHPEVDAAPNEEPNAELEEIARLNDELESSMMKALLLESQLVENQIASSKLERAHDLELKQLRAQLAEAATRIGELENFEKEYRATAALVETLTRDLHELKVEKEGWQKETQEKLDAKEKEIMDLEKRTSEAAEEKQVLEQGNAVVVQRLTAENLRLTHRLEEREQAFTKEKTELTKRVHEVEAIAAELQWSEGSEHGLQRVLQEVTRESDAFKRQIHELEARVLSQQQDRGQHELEMSRLQRQLVEARRESTGISTLSLDTRPAPRLASRIPEIQSDPPPPAYDDAVFV